MRSTPEVANYDTGKPDGFYVQFKREVIEDIEHGEPDWLFQDHAEGPAYQARLAAYRAGEWSFVGIRAIALCQVVKNGVGTFINLESPGLWGVESDAGEPYFNEIYRDEVNTLKDMIESMRNPVYK